MPRSFRNGLLYVLGLCMLALPAAAMQLRTSITPTPETLTIDLASMVPDGVTKRPGGRDVVYDKIKIINVIPRFWPYGVDIAIVDVGVPPLSFPGPAPTTPRGGGPPSLGESVNCSPFITSLEEELDAVETEKKVAEIGAAAIAAATPAICKDKVEARFKELTQYTIEWKISIKSFQTLTVTLARKGATFTLQLPGTPRGEWRTSYGFFFVPDRDERYFVQENRGANGAPSTFQIRKQDDREEFDFVPTVVFTFFPNGAGQKGGLHGVTAGLGYDLEKPFVFGGYSYSYNENVIFSGGVAFHRQARLLGKYDTEDLDRRNVGQMLEPSQLVEDTYGPNVYVGVSFRFGEDIHARRKELEEARAKEAAASAAARAAAKAAEDESTLRKAECIARATAAAATAKAAADCKDDPLCIAKVEAEEAAAKAKCPLTELERVRALKEEDVKKQALAKAEKRAACENAAKATNAAALAKCAKDLDECKKKAKTDVAKKACEEDTVCETDAADALAGALNNCIP